MIEIKNDRDNCFDLLRLVLATLVLVGHSFILGGFGDSPFTQHTRGQFGLAHIGVMGFFGLSGYLVSWSFVRTDHWRRFLVKRFRRILPGYWVCLVVTAFMIAPMIRLSGGGSFEWSESFSFVVQNFLVHIRQWTIGSVVSGNPYSESLNGSLWSLYPEMKSYLVLFILGSLGALARSRWVLPAMTAYVFIVYLLSLSGEIVSDQLGPTALTLDQNLFVYLAFLTGMTLFSFRETVICDARSAVVLFLGIVFTLKFGGFRLLGPVLLTWFLISAAFAWTVRLKHDLSYGMYIYGFAVQQFLATLEPIRAHWLLFFLTSVLVTTMFAAFSWFGVERRFLRTSN